MAIAAVVVVVVAFRTNTFVIPVFILRCYCVDATTAPSSHASTHRKPQVMCR